MTNHESDTPKPAEVISYLGATNTGDIVIVTEGIDGSYLEEDLSGGGNLNRAQDLFLEQQRLSALFNGGEPVADEVEDSDTVSVNMDEIRRQIAIAQNPEDSNN